MLAALFSTVSSTTVAVLCAESVDSCPPIKLLGASEAPAWVAEAAFAAAASFFAVLDRVEKFRVAIMVVNIAPLSFRLALNFFKHSTVSCLWTADATRSLLQIHGCFKASWAESERRASLSLYYTSQTDFHQKTIDDWHKSQHERLQCVFVRKWNGKHAHYSFQAVCFELWS